MVELKTPAFSERNKVPIFEKVELVELKKIGFWKPARNTLGAPIKPDHWILWLIKKIL